MHFLAIIAMYQIRCIQLLKSPKKIIKYITREKY